jgi:branched-chain amino acid transport system ATP-binding protein
MADTEILLRGQHISRRWGGLLALNDVSIDVARGTVHASLAPTARANRRW